MRNLPLRSGVVGVGRIVGAASALDEIKVETTQRKRVTIDRREICNDIFVLRCGRIVECSRRSDFTPLDGPLSTRPGVKRRPGLGFRTSCMSLTLSQPRPRAVIVVECPCIDSLRVAAARI